MGQIKSVSFVYRWFHSVVGMTFFPVTSFAKDTDSPTACLEDDEFSMIGVRANCTNVRVSCVEVFGKFLEIPFGDLQETIAIYKIRL